MFGRTRLHWSGGSDGSSRGEWLREVSGGEGDEFISTRLFHPTRRDCRGHSRTQDFTVGDEKSTCGYAI